MTPFSIDAIRHLLSKLKISGHQRIYNTTSKTISNPRFTQLGALLLSVGLIAIAFQSVSSASVFSGSADKVKAISLSSAQKLPTDVDKRVDVKTIDRLFIAQNHTLFNHPNSVGLLPVMLQLFTPTTVTVTAGNCSTAKTIWNLGESVCARVIGSSFFPRRLFWVNADSTIVRSVDLNTTSSEQTDILPLPTGVSADNLGTWRAVVINRVTIWPESVVSFTVESAANPTADLQINTISSPGGVAAGGHAVFQLQVTNGGPSTATNVHLLDAVPADTSFVSFIQLTGPTFTCSSPAVGDSSGSTDCSIASLAKDATATFIASYQVSSVPVGTEITNTAGISSSATNQQPATADQNARNNSTDGIATVAYAPCTLSTPDNVTVDVDPGQAGATVTYPYPTSSSGCGSQSSTVMVSCTPDSGSFFNIGTTPVTCTSNAGGLSTFLVTVNNPGGGLTITLNGANPFALECGTNFEDPGVTALDGANQSVPVTTTSTVDNHLAGSYLITYTADDGQGHTASTTRTVNVSDTAAPIISLNGANPMAVSCASNFVDPGATALDACEGAKPVTASGTVDTSTPGTYTLTYTATDSGGRTQTATRSVIVGNSLDDPPTITVIGGDPDDHSITLECGSAFTDPGATATVGCSGTAPVTSSGTVDTHTPGSYTITYHATAGSQSSDAVRTVTVVDTTAPTIALSGASTMTVECHTSFTDPGATAHDGCAGDFAATASGAVDPNTVGSYTITYNASDPSGNAATPVTRTVNVVDTTPPAITVDGGSSTDHSITVECHTSFTDPGATAQDGCAGSLMVTPSGTVDVNTPGDYVITYSAYDGANTATQTRTVHVVDTMPPTISCPAGISVTVAPNSTATSVTLSPGTATAQDSCSTSPTVTGTRSDGQPLTAPYPVGLTTITWKATDPSGNHVECQQTIQVSYLFTGFFSPVNNLPTLNQVNAGRAIPVKFSLSGNKGLNIFAVASPSSQQITCDTGVPVADVLETVTAGNSSLSYASSSDQYDYVWATSSSWAGTCRQLIVRLNDGTTHRANFKFK